MHDPISVYAPGSTSNLGPGFDCLGVALSGGGDRIVARHWDGEGVRIARVSDDRIPVESSRNTAAIAALAVSRRATQPPPGIELEIEKGLPLSGGLGGSAASAVAGAVVADALLGLELPDVDLLEAALEAEAVVAGRHADNVAPSYYGGGVLVVSIDPLRLERIDVHASVRFVLCAPDYGVETAAARAVLPSVVQRSAAIAQAAHCGALVLGLASGDADLLRLALPGDRIALPAREVLYPGYAEARTAGLDAGAWGVVVSGAGPTLLALTGEAAGVAVGEAMVDGFRRAGYAATPRVAAVDVEGARVLCCEGTS